MRKSTIIAVFVAIQSLLFSDVSYGNILKNDHYEDFTLDSSAKSEINQALNVESRDQPIYFVVVTRPSSKLNAQLDYRTEGVALKEVLQNICGDDIDVSKLASYPNMSSYVTNNKDELEKSCKIVVFNEHFFYRKPLSDPEYEVYKNVFSRLSDSCSKTIFYPNFLRARSFDPTTDNACKDRYNRTVAETTLREISAVHGMAFDGAKNLLHNLANNLKNRYSAVLYGEEKINDLADYLEISIPYDAQLSKAVSLANYLTQGNVFPAISKLMQSPALALDERLGRGLAQEINDAIRLSQTLSSEVEGLGDVSAGFAQSLKTCRSSFVKIKKYYESSRINTTSLILPITNPDYVISNVTYSIYRGKILTQYEKGSYFQEADNDIGFTQSNDLKKSIYSFGTGSDSAVNIEPNADGSELTNDYLNLQRVLLQNVSTEICLDLYDGVRHSNGWTNETTGHQSKIHIIQSNSIDPIGRTYNSSPNISHLPRSSDDNNICILQADTGFELPVGSHLFKINSSGAPILHRKEAELEIPSAGIKVTVYKLN